MGFALFAAESPRHRLIVLADMGNEPDEEQQMVHMLMCSNEFDVEGLIAVTGKYLRRNPRPDLFMKLIDGYENVVDNLKLHAGNWPTPEHLRSVTKPGQPAYGMADVGEEHSSPGSKLIVDAVTKDDPRPIWVVVNAGSNTLAQALVDYQAMHTPAEVDAFVAKLRVFENGSQDNAGAWICSRFPKIHWIRSNYQTYAYGGPGGRDGDTFSNLGPYYWKPYENTPDGQHGWLQEHVQTGHGALGELYPDRYLPRGQEALFYGRRRHHPLARLGEQGAFRYRSTVLGRLEWPLLTEESGRLLVAPRRHQTRRTESGALLYLPRSE